LPAPPFSTPIRPARKLTAPPARILPISLARRYGPDTGNDHGASHTPGPLRQHSAWCDRSPSPGVDRRPRASGWRGSRGKPGFKWCQAPTGERVAMPPGEGLPDGGAEGGDVRGAGPVGPTPGPAASTGEALGASGLEGRRGRVPWGVLRAPVHPGVQGGSVVATPPPRRDESASLPNLSGCRPASARGATRVLFGASTDN
jgi:hypothetical protein